MLHTFSYNDTAYKLILNIWLPGRKVTGNKLSFTKNGFRFLASFPTSNASVETFTYLFILQVSNLRVGMNKGFG